MSQIGKLAQPEPTQAEMIDRAVKKALKRAVLELPRFRRTVVEKIITVDPRAYTDGMALSAKLEEQFERGKVLLHELRAAREALLAAKTS